MSLDFLWPPMIETSPRNRPGDSLAEGFAQNWRGKPLVTHQVIVELIAATTTKTRLRIESRLDERTYAKGRRISDARMAEVNLLPDAFHGEWNYTISPIDS